jgi:hypothetical protein
MNLATPPQKLNFLWQFDELFFKILYRAAFFFIFGLWCRWPNFIVAGYTSGENTSVGKKLVATVTIIKVPLGNSIKQQIVLTG